MLLSLIMAPQRSSVVPVGSMAPAFSVSDDRGTTRSLAEFKGKYVVLEWHENGCPYVAKHYKGGAMQRRQAEWMGRGVVWLLVNSSTDGSHSYLTPETSREYFKSLERSKEAVLRQDLSVLRDAIDKFNSDLGHNPDTLADLVAHRYVRSLPVDPFTRNAESWVVTMSDDDETPGIVDVHSSAPGAGLDGTPRLAW